MYLKQEPKIVLSINSPDLRSEKDHVFLIEGALKNKYIHILFRIKGYNVSEMLMVMIYLRNLRELS